jgi:hypothetical protein
LGKLAVNELEEYHQSLMTDIRREADVSGILMVEAFFDRMAERLPGAGELETADRAFFQSGEGAQKLRVDGYAGDPRESQGVLGLIICDFVDSNEVKTFGKAEIAPLLNPLIRFFKKARTTEFRDSLNEVNPAFQLSDLIITTWSQISKIKLILISNRQYIGRDDAVKLAETGGIPITYSVWDLARFEKFDRSGQEREDMSIDFAKDFGGPLPALRASQTGAALDSYLMIVPGQQLAEIYEKWGPRLLEANVRSFLQARAKTNKGIQKTIKDSPELFFPYNNGLSATADSVTCVEGKHGLNISEIRNLQIVNGAQTTGSIHSGLKAAREQLLNVYVQMKLTVVPSDRSEEIVPRISEFANTQNKVNAADFFSNHPFHVRMEHYSRSILFARKEGERHDSKWFYERSRGQFINARSKLTTAQLRKFDLEYPKTQLFTKTDLAKFELSAAGSPHIVSRGAQKNFAEFAKDIGDAWTKGEARFDELWYKRLVAKALIFRKLEAEIPKQSWYEGGYRANIVTYAMAKVFHDADDSRQVLDLDTIWRQQLVSEDLLSVLLIAAAGAHDAITHPPQGVRNMSEWAKQQGCWHSFKSRDLEYGERFDNVRISIEDSQSNKREARVDSSLNEGIVAQAEVVQLGSDFWRKVMDWARAQRKVTPKELQILNVCSSIPRQLPTDYQAIQVLNVLARLKGQGLNT